MSGKRKFTSLVVSAFIAPAFLLTFLSAAQCQEEKQKPDILDGPKVRQTVEGAIKEVEMFGTHVDLVSIEEIEKLAKRANEGTGQETKIDVTKKDESGWTELGFQLDGAKMKLTRVVGDSKPGVEHLDSFTTYMYQELADGEMDAHVYSLIRKVKRTNHLYKLEGTPAMPGVGIRFVKKFAAQSNAIVLSGNSVSDPDLQKLLGPDKTVNESAELPEFESAESRKQRSMKILAEKKLKPNASLPNISADEETNLRDAKHVAKRAICLMAIAAHAEQAPDFDAMKFIKDHQAIEVLSASEKAFVENDKLTARERSIMTWRYEALWALLWSLDKVDKIGFPDKQCDAKVAIGVVLEGADALVKNAKFRDKAEILDQADLLYRCYWLTRDATSKGTQVQGISGSVVYERLYALNWLIRYMKTDWDNVVVDS